MPSRAMPIRPSMPGSGTAVPPELVLVVVPPEVVEVVVDPPVVVEVVVDDAAGTRFSVPLRSRYPRPAVQWPMPERLLAVSDLEGNFAAATRLLRDVGEKLKTAPPLGTQKVASAEQNADKAQQ